MEKLKKTDYYEMDYSTLEELVEKHLGFNPECIANWEMGNDSSKPLVISKTLDKYEEDELKNLLENGEQDYNCPDLCMVELCRKGIIPEGNYLINICW